MNRKQLRYAKRIASLLALSCLAVGWTCATNDDPLAERLLLYGSRNGHENVASLALSLGGGQGGYGPLATHGAEWSGHHEIMERILEHGIESTARNGVEIEARNGHTVVLRKALDALSDEKATAIAIDVLETAATALPLSSVATLAGALVERNDPRVADALVRWIEGGVDETLVFALLGAGMSPDAESLEGTTALMAAVERDRASVVDKLLQLGADANAPDDRGDTPLLASLRSDNSRIETLLRRAGATASTEEERRHRLVALVRAGSLSEVERLISEGVRIHETYAVLEGRGALDEAARAGQYPVVRLLLERECWGVAELERARKESAGPAPAEELRNALAGVLRETREFHRAAGRGDIPSMEARAERCAQIDYELHGWSPLSRAVLFRERRAVSWLLRRGVDPERRNRHEVSAVDLAATIDFDFPWPPGVQPASETGEKRARGFLLQPQHAPLPIASEADPGIPSGTADSLGPEVREEIVRTAAALGWPVDRNFSVKPPVPRRRLVTLFEAVRAGDFDVVRALLAAGHDPNQFVPSGGTSITLPEPKLPRGEIGVSPATPLGMAAMLGNVAMAKLLVEARGDPVRGGALDVAAMAGQLEMVRFFLDARPELHGSLDLGSPLVAASRFGRDDVVRFLLGRGANVNTGRPGETPLAWAVVNGHVGTVRLLLEHGADPERGNLAGTTVFEIVEQTGSAEIRDLLLSRRPSAQRSIAPTRRK